MNLERSPPNGVTNQETSRIFRYWGKGSRGDDAESRKHLLVYHLLDVAAVGAILLDRHPTLLRRLAAMLGLDRELTRGWLLWLLAQHDIGKFAAAFQRLRPDLCVEQIPDTYRYTERHDTLGYLLWKDHLLGRVFPGLEAYSPLEDGLLTLLATSSGHHGRPPSRSDWSRGWFREKDIGTAQALSGRVSELFFGAPRPGELAAADDPTFRERVAEASWSLAGFTVLCDWIGSNGLWFPFVEEIMELGTYWELHALPRAREAVEAAGVLPCPALPSNGFHRLFPGLASATSLQRLADAVVLHGGPQLFLIEDLTGSGKTEAALTLAGRLLAAGEAEGLYVALPTTATADAMYGRVGKVYGGMFQPGSRPSLVLAHSRRDLSRDFRQSVGGERIETEASYSPGEQGAAATSSAWLADSRKKALLAQVGVGTIDQALLAVLNVRHQSLRAVGLLGKVLIVDEVHACDAYMNRLLERLLELHAAQGGSAILLSATLPLKTRKKLVAAFAAGAGFDPPGELPDDYPQLLAVSGSGLHWRPAEPPPWSRRTLGFELVHDPSAALEWVLERARTGASVAWIRNTVRDAIEAYDQVAAQVGAERVTLFHARFALGDRLDIEAEVLRCFGKDSTSTERSGRVVIATQVIEQSLDLDFDEMLSDLAPIDLLLQRAGRLRRHRRDRGGSKHDGPDCRGRPVLHVLTPEPVDDPPEAWITTLLPGTSFVYPDHAELWRTARLIAERPTVQLPADSRWLVEQVFGSASSLDLPEALQGNATQAEGQRRADASQGEVNAITVCAGYGGGYDSWTDREDTRTRLGEPTLTLRLARWDGRELQPMCPDEDPRLAWRLSEVSVRRSQVSATQEPADPHLAVTVGELLARPAWRHGRFLLLPMVQGSDGSWEGTAAGPDGEPRTVSYRRSSGLEVAR